MPTSSTRQSLRTNRKVSPTKVLQQAIDKKISGQITISDVQDPAIGWRVYCSDGQIHFAESTIGQKERLNHLLQGYISAQEAAERQSFNCDYTFLCHLWKSHSLELGELRQILAMITQEALIQFLAVPQAQVEWEPKIGLDPLILSISLPELILPIRDRISQWSLMRSEIRSPFYKPFIRDRNKFDELLWVFREIKAPDDAIDTALEQGHCLYHLASQFNQEILDLAIAFQPLVKGGAIGVEPYRIVEAPTRPVVACVDDSKTIQQFVKMALASSDYDVLSLLDPTQAIPNLLEHQPALILMDIEMPKLNGYELCRQLRQHKSLEQTPIVMLTRREGMVDRIRARLVGAVEYLPKPFNFSELLDLVQRLPAMAST